MPQDNGTLRFEIDGRWKAANMIASIKEVNFLYNLRLYLDNIEENFAYYDGYLMRPPGSRAIFFHYNPLAPIILRPDDIQQLAAAYFPESELQIARMEYASPGFTDFLGIGRSLEAVDKLVRSMITIRHDLESKKLQNNAQRIENERNFVKLRLERARAENEIARLQTDRLAELVGDNTRELQKLVDNGLITDVMMLEDKVQEED